MGKDGGLPWHLPADLAYFKRLTAGRHVIMGRRTFESIGSRALPGRPCVVLSRDPAYRPSGVTVKTSLGAALDHCAEKVAEDETVFVAGGRSLFKEAMRVADRLYITVVHAVVEGDVVFPGDRLADWKIVSDEIRPADKANAHSLSFRVYERP